MKPELALSMLNEFATTQDATIINRLQELLKEEVVIANRPKTSKGFEKYVKWVVKEMNNRPIMAGTMFYNGFTYATDGKTAVRKSGDVSIAPVEGIEALPKYFDEKDYTEYTLTQELLDNINMQFALAKVELKTTNWNKFGLQDVGMFQIIPTVWVNVALLKIALDATDVKVGDKFTTDGRFSPITFKGEKDMFLILPIKRRDK